MKCPSCKFEQADGRLDCEYCGLIFAKWNERHAPPPAATVPLESGALADPLSESTDAKAISPPLEGDIPDRPTETPLLYGQRPRLYTQIAALDFQRTQSGDWLYFPWGVFGRGYRLKSPEMKNEIERFLTLFCCVHSPMAAILGLSALLTWLSDSETPFEGFVFLFSYLAMAYLFLAVRANQWTSHLSPSANRLNQKQYYFQFFKIFNWRTLFDLEVVSLVLVLSCLWLWLSDKWKWFLAAENISILWMWLVFFGIILALFSYLYYFRKK